METTVIALFLLQASLLKKYKPKAHTTVFQGIAVISQNAPVISKYCHHLQQLFVNDGFAVMMPYLKMPLMK